MDRISLTDEYFLENRDRVLDVAAFLDRLDRAGGADDFRVAALRAALRELAGAAAGRTARIQMLLSDPSTAPKPALDRKGAVGAWDPDA